jgi:hypothetical protein
LDDDNSQEKAEKVPAAMAERFRELAALADGVCREHLNESYAALARKGLAALCRKRPSPVITGRAEVWACAVLYALGQVNFLSDRSQKPCMNMEDLARCFGISQSTASNKAKQVREWLGMSQFGHRWLLPERLDDFAAVWLLEVNGFLVDIRKMPRGAQAEAFRRGLIPYIPADRQPPPG